MPPSLPTTAPPSTWADLRACLRRDRARLRSHFASYGVAAPRFLAAHPSYQCVWLHRLSSHYFRNGHRLRGRLFWHLNLLLTGADFSPISQVGPGLVVVHPISSQLFGRLGADCTLWGHGGIGGGRSAVDVGAGPGLPVVGDRVCFGARSMVLGPVRVGDDCVLGAGCIVTRDVASGSTVEMTGRQRIIRAAAEIDPLADGLEPAL